MAPHSTTLARSRRWPKESGRALRTKHARTVFSGIDFVEADETDRPLIVGERTNEVGSRRFKRLITDEKYEEASEIARRQVKGGAQIIDVNLQNADRDELHDSIASTRSSSARCARRS